MAWNEPGKGSRDPNQNPWGNGGDKGSNLDESLKRFGDKLGRFGQGGGPMLIIGLIVVLWVLADSWVAIDARQVGVVLRFGDYTRTLQPGFHLKFPWPVEEVTKVATTEVRTYSEKVSMLTKDENIMHIAFNVQFQVKDARHLLFSMRDPIETLHEASEASVRSVIGRAMMDEVLSGSGAQLANDTQEMLQETLDEYQSGIQVTDVSFQNVAPPEQVRDAFDDVNKAREDKQRIENLAHAYASKVIPEARGEAARIIAEAKGFSSARVALAKGNADRFTKILEQYEAAPQVTRRRLWLETMEDVLVGNRTIIDGSEGRNLLYLPVMGDTSKLPAGAAMKSAGAAGASEVGMSAQNNAAGAKQ